jgi:hypothetical protein
MAEFDPLDAIDEKGRLKRLLIALAVGIGCAVAAYGALYALAQPDSSAAINHEVEGAGGASKFVWYFTALAFAVPFIIAQGVLNNLEKKRWLKQLERSRIPEAKQL